MAGIAERVRRRDDRAGSLVFWEGCGLVACVSGPDRDDDEESGLEGDTAASGFEGSCSAYNLSSSSHSSGTTAPLSIRASRYCEARYAL